MKRKKLSLPAIGASAVLSVFAVLCLVVFAVLSLSMAQAQKRASAAYIRATEAYYAADLAAEEIFARLRAGETVAGVHKDGDTYRYSCLISEQQSLEVELEDTAGGWIVCQWQVCTVPVQINETIGVWDGR